MVILHGFPGKLSRLSKLTLPIPPETVKFFFLSSVSSLREKLLSVLFQSLNSLISSPVPGLDFGVNCTVASSNYRMPEMAAAIGVTQIKRADEFVSKRNILADKYKSLLNGEILEVPDIPSNITMTWWQYIVALPKGTSLEQRTEFVKDLLEKYNIPTANAYWPACHVQPTLLKYVGNTEYPVADDLLARHFALPMYVEMDLDQVEYVANSVNKLLDDHQYTSA